MKIINWHKPLSCIAAFLLAVLCVVPVQAADTYNQEHVISGENNYNDVIKMTDEQALEYFEEFLSSQPYEVIADNSTTQKKLEAFEQYAVDEGIIADTAEQRGAITKAVVRAEFEVVVAGGNLAGFYSAADLLDHSLQDYPSDLNYASSSSHATRILNSSECKKLISEFKASVKGTSISSKMTSGSITLNSTTDLHLAYNKVKYVINGTKTTSGSWKLQIKFKDTYDFEEQAWKNAMTDNVVVTALNNYAAYAQDIGAIVPYDITVNVSASFS